MKIIEITYSMGQTVQVRDFHPRNFHVSLRAELEENEDESKAHQVLKNKAEAIIKRDVEELQAKINESQSNMKLKPRVAPQPDTTKHVDTDVSKLEEGVYVVWFEGIKQMYRKKIVYKGQPQEKDKSFYSKYDEGSVECQPQNITKDLTI